jgi:hypothetical protein
MKLYMIVGTRQENRLRAMARDIQRRIERETKEKAIALAWSDEKLGLTRDGKSIRPIRTWRSA